jgi:hypothetical protein
MKDLRKLSRREVLIATAAAGACPKLFAQGRRREPAPPFVPSDGANNPVGIGKGINPGRVAWVRNTEATKWDGVTEPAAVKSATGEWWDDANCDPQVVAAMVSTSLQGLTGKKSDRDAWTALFRHFNQTRNLGNSGYKRGEKISIKLNMNNDMQGGKGPFPTPWRSGQPYPSPQVIHSLLRQLVQVAGVPGDDITVFDATQGRYVGDLIFKRIKSDPDERLHAVHFQVNPANAKEGREPVVPDTTDPIKFSDPAVGTAFVPKCVVDAKYRINVALLRAHGICGVTLCTKNNNGSIYWPAKDYWGPQVYHNFISRSRPLGSYNAFVDIMGHRQIGGKGLLYVIDGLYSGQDEGRNVIRFGSLGGHWTSSVFMSQDPVAIDSVGLDFLRSEPLAINVNGGFPDNFLHEAAQVGNPPSGTKYDPEQDGTTITTSLGVHEHWNNPQEKKYSRNLGKKEGIELVALSAKIKQSDRKS